jgi:hypothetical protein
MPTKNERCRLCNREMDVHLYGVCFRCIRRLIDAALDERKGIGYGTVRKSR